MKKVLFSLSGLISIMMAYKIGIILLYDFNRLTAYGFGYLTGLIVTFSIVSAFAISLGFKVFRKDQFP